MNGRAFRDRIRKYTELHGMMAAGEKIAVALSGGADSVCLLLILKALGYDVVAIHCNFHLRGEESKRDEDFVVSLCERIGVELKRTDFDTLEYAHNKGMSIELAARELRYEYFAKVMNEEGCNCLAVGHHKDDNAETFLLNCIRKTGVKGLGGIKPVSTNRYGCKVVRPLLCVDREDITDYLNEQGERWVTDSTNLKDDVARNKIRLDVMPVLKDINQGVVGNFCDTMENATELTKIYEDWVEKEKLRCSTWKDEHTLCIYRDRLATSVSPVSVMHELLSPMGFNDTQVRNLLTAKGYRANRPKGEYEMTLPNGKTVRIELKWKVLIIRN